MLPSQTCTLVHEQVDLGDPAVMACYLAYLHHKLSGKYRHVDEHLLGASIEDALLRHLVFAERYDAARGVPLASYLEMWTHSYLDKRLRKVKRRRKHEKAVGVSGENFEKIVSENWKGKGIYLQMGRRVLDEWSECLEAIVMLLNPHDRVEVQLLREGASFEEWVRYLRIEHLPLEEQRRKVNAEKDRLKKKLKRWAQRMQGGRFRVRAQVRGASFDAGRERESWLINPKMLQSRRMEQRGDTLLWVAGYPLDSERDRQSSASYSSFSVCCCS